MSGSRTPVRWPHMKIRGAQRKRKTAQRVTYRTEVLGVPAFNTDGSYTFRVVSREEPGCMRLVLTRVEDGWGRVLRRPAARSGGAGGG